MNDRGDRGPGIAGRVPNQAHGSTNRVTVTDGTVGRAGGREQDGPEQGRGRFGSGCGAVSPNSLTILGSREKPSTP